MSSNTVDGEKRYTNISSPSTLVTAYALRKSNHNQIILSMVMITVDDFRIDPVLCRVLLDSGLQQNCMTEAMV